MNIFSELEPGSISTEDTQLLFIPLDITEMSECSINYRIVLHENVTRNMNTYNFVSITIVKFLRERFDHSFASPETNHIPVLSTQDYFKVLGILCKDLIELNRDHH
ncbi:hypothetical protein JTE90_019720 [Oedothorax gibbosus]|uniref:Uncharacterized protein n=1 Tax=Oedothorax gibbosus TaxID=931172 RepID=A0AAV6UQ90_9ARAC|nr:hypothetical protein JTE90_019720 [Oedothorax gibbosus]